MLGAHLEAYIKTWPILMTLRLCSRVSKGNTIQKLPAELLQLIESYLIRNGREENWNSLFNCFKKVCEGSDHLTKAEQLKVFMIRREETKDDAEVRRQDHSEENVERFLDDFEFGLLDIDIYGRHHERKYARLALVGGPERQLLRHQPRISAKPLRP